MRPCWLFALAFAASGASFVGVGCASGCDVGSLVTGVTLGVEVVEVESIGDVRPSCVVDGVVVVVVVGVGS